MKTPPTSNAASRKSYGGHYDIFDLDRTTGSKRKGQQKKKERRVSECLQEKRRERKEGHLSSLKHG